MSKSLFPPAEWWVKNGLPVPEPEARFHPVRQWRFDYYFPSALLAIEIEGGAWKNGRHNRAKGFFADMDKYNAAAEIGIRVLRYPSIDKINVVQVKRCMNILPSNQPPVGCCRSAAGRVAEPGRGEKLN